MTATSLARPCPFCSATVEAAPCPQCKRDPTMPRRVCASCNKMTPTREPACCHCKTVAVSELRWKIPVIIAIFSAAIVVSILLTLAR